MSRSVGRLAFAFVLSLWFAAACGSEDDKKRAATDDGGEAGAAGAPSQPSGGGSMNRAGAPSTDAGVGGELPSHAGQGGASEPAATAGAAGEAGSETSGAGGAASACCSPKTCADLVGAECGLLDDGCGHPERFCECAPGSSCVEGSCSPCESDSEFCYDNNDACGDTVDNCGLPITCPDNCSSQTSGGFCRDGFCCSAKLECDGNDCGVVSNNCGGTLDCTNNFCDVGTCQDGHCCSPNEGDACADVACGYGWDGCKDVFCGDPCAANEACMDNECQVSVCKANGFDCDRVDNAVAPDGSEYCGVCSEGEACVANRCQPLCH